jgi:hypothetical protein
MAKSSKKRAIRRKVGDVLRIPLGSGEYGFGRVLRSVLYAFYDAKSPPDLSIDEIIGRPILFKVCVMDYAVKKGVWEVIGNAPLTEDLLIEPWFFKKDPISRVLTLYRDSTAEEIPANRSECEKLECAAVWDPEHVADRLRDHFAGRPNKWVLSMRP